MNSEVWEASFLMKKRLSRRFRNTLISGIPAIILETKSESEDISLQKWVKELTKNCNIALTQYKHVVGILYNGTSIRVFLDNIEAESTAPTLQNKSYYLALFSKNTIDKQKIYTLTKRINDCLHIDFGIKNLYHRMIFTACALVGKRYGALLVKGMGFTLMKNSILSTLSKSLEESRKQNLNDSSISIGDGNKIKDSSISTSNE